jgi:single-strand DNA-binding protein
MTLQVYGIGNLTRDPEVRYTSNGKLQVTCAIATNRRYRNSKDELIERTDFVDLEAYGKTAEIMKEYAEKGKQVFIEGTLRHDRWEKDGARRQKHKVVLNRIYLLASPGRKPGNEEKHGSMPESY